MTGIPVVRYSRDRLPLADGPGALPPSEWPEWCLTSEPDAPAFPAVRILGAFEVDVDGQVTECADGWLALDEDGRPFPISVQDFRRYGRWHPEPEEH